ncbi:MAG: LPS-assembly protein LptD [Bacteroidaceae bacterium]|nr:LPS-assembly protein LptD [Bacteroidaceae bacterium]
MTQNKLHRIIPFLVLVACLMSGINADAQRARNRRRGINDTIRVDSLGKDTVALDTVGGKKKQPLDAPVVYSATDSIVFTAGGFAHLYGQSKVNYEKIELTSEVITMNMDSSTVYARGVVDSMGVESGLPVFKDGDTPYESKEMRYNFKSKKGFINSIVTQQGEGYVVSKEAKKGANDEIYMRSGQYTTCDDHDHPHFYLKLSRAKVRPKKNAVFGPAQLVVEDVPLPIAIPFGFFPFNSSYSSGFIMPTFGDEMNRGFYLRDGGYYFAINDNVDLKVLGEVFTKGSWGLSTQSNYAKRYKYSGSFNASYLVTKTGEKNMPDYMVTKDFKFSWSHRQDPKASPNSTFSANVNFATSSYDRRNLSSLYNPQQYANNTKASSVSYSRTFPSIGLNLSSTFNITQNTRDSSLSVTLPDLNISLNRLYPFKRKKAAGEERWYEKIAVQYTGRLTNSISTKDNLILKQGLSKWNNGMQHTIPVSATFTLFKYLNVVPSFNYTERWYTRKVMQNFDPVANAVVRDTVSGFNRVYNYNLSLQMNTKLYGFFKPWKMFGDKVQMIRHVFTPSVSFSYAPDFGQSRYGYYDTYTYTDTNGEVRIVEYSPYQGMAFGVPGKGMQKSFNFSIDNNVEMKVKSDKDTTGVKKISLIDQLSANMSYNAAAKTRPWSDLSMNLRLKLTKSYTFNMNASFATYAYQYDDRGNIVVGDRTEWSYGRFGRFQGYSGSFSYTLNNDTWKKWFGKSDEDKGNKEEDEEFDDEYQTDEEREELRKKQSQPRKKEQANITDDGYLAFKMPWSLSLSYSYSIREDKNKEKFNRKTMRYPYALTHSLNASGNVKLGSRWNVNYSSGYDFTQKKMSMTTVNISRDLHCFTMSCGLVFGPFTSYNFSIRALSTMLTDALKWDQRSNTGSAVTWY